MKERFLVHLLLSKIQMLGRSLRVDKNGKVRAYLQVILMWNSFAKLIFARGDSVANFKLTQF